MRVLWVATKPPLPAVDGGRRVTIETIAALDDAGIDGVVVAPGVAAASMTLGRWRLVEVPAAPRWAAPRHYGFAGSLAVARHVQPAVRATVARLLASGPAVDVVHAEQLHAVPQCEPAFTHGVPVLLRAQNVEHEVVAARTGGGIGGRLRALETRRIEAFERACVRRVDATVALTAGDVARLAALAGPGADVRHVAAPFPAHLPPGPPRDGAPAVVLFGSDGWFPNRDGAAWFVAAVWPAVRARLPRARLHVFGLDCRAPSPAGVTRHPAPADSRVAFARDAIFVVASGIATGVRMKILEAWARGLPVVTTPAAASGLAADAPAFLEADGADAFATAIARLHADPTLAGALRDAGRAALATHHAPRRIAAQIAGCYASIADRAAPRITPDPRPPAPGAPAVAPP